MGNINTFNTDNRVTRTVSVTSGQTESSAVYIAGTTLTAIYTPSTFTGSAITFLVSHDGITFKEYRNPAGSTVSITIVADTWCGILGVDFSAFNHIKLVCGSSQASTAELILQTRPTLT